MKISCKLNIDEIEFFLVKQKFESNKIEDVRMEVNKQLEKINAKSLIPQNGKIAVTAGSRGINNIVEITRAVVDYIKGAGGSPFIVPSMGSHGSANAAGQLHVLTELGITEETMGVPIKSSVECVVLGKLDNGAPVYFDKIAHEADGVAVINRIKPHTDFDAKIESGLIKMVAVGLGNQLGCSTMHTYGLSESIPESFKVSKEKENILFGLGILENSKDETMELVGLRTDEFETEEQKLLAKVKNLVPKIPVNNLDLLIVEEMGKMYSGTGMDTKVIGRIKIDTEVDPPTPKIKKLAVLNLASNSYGNALGIGLADITTKKLVDSIDIKATYENIISTTYLERGKIPITLSDEEETISVGINTSGDVTAQDVKICVIKNTLELEEMYFSKAALDTVDKEKIEIIETGIVMTFDTEGNMILQGGRK